MKLMKLSFNILSFIMAVCVLTTFFSCSSRVSPVPEFSIQVSNGIKRYNKIYCLINLKLLYDKDAAFEFLDSGEGAKKDTGLFLYSFNTRTERGQKLIELSEVKDDFSLKKYQIRAIFITGYKQILFISFRGAPTDREDNKRGNFIYRYNLAAGKGRIFMENAYFPVASPDEKKIAFLRNNHIWISDIKGKKQRKISRTES